MAVTDSNRTHPSCGPRDVRFSRLWLVDQLTDRWGVDEEQSTRVWCEISTTRRPDPTTATPAPDSLPLRDPAGKPANPHDSGAVFLVCHRQKGVGACQGEDAVGRAPWSCHEDLDAPARPRASALKDEALRDVV